MPDTTQVQEALNEAVKVSESIDNALIENENIAKNNAADIKSFTDSKLDRMYASTVYDYLGIRTPLVSALFRQAPKPVVFDKWEEQLKLPTASVTDSSKTWDAIGASHSHTSQALTYGLGSHGRITDIMRKDLQLRANQLKILGQNFVSDGAIVDPINDKLRPLFQDEFRGLETRAWNGTAVSGFGTLGQKTQHNKANTTTTVNATLGTNDNAPVWGTNEDNSFNKGNYTNAQAGYDAWAKNIFDRYNDMVIYGVDHVMVEVPRGAGSLARNILVKYQNSQTNVSITFNVPAKGVPTDLGTVLSPFGNDGAYYVNDQISVVEIQGMSNGECYLYPDVVYGQNTMSTREFVTGNAPRGYVRRVSADNKELLNLAGVGNLPEHFLTPLYATASDYNKLVISIEWLGQFVFSGVVIGCLYNQVLFFNSSSLVTRPDSNTTNAAIDMMS